MTDFDHGLYARSFADVYDAWYRDLDDPAHLVAAVTERCPTGARVVELGSGTGRLAAPLHRAGFAVVAVDISLPMLTIAAPGPSAVVADMAQLPLAAESASAVIIAYNTLFNLPGHALQQQCFVEASRVLRHGGFLAIEAFVAPEIGPGDFGLSRRPHPTRPQTNITILTGPHATNADVIVGSHIEVEPERTCRPWQLAYQTPDQLDSRATAAGLSIDARCSDWQGSKYDPHEHRHVSWYKRF